MTWELANKSQLLDKQKPLLCGEEEPLLFHTEMEEELAEEVPIRLTTKEMIGKRTMVVEERLLLVPELMETNVGEVAEDAKRYARGCWRERNRIEPTNGL